MGITAAIVGAVGTGFTASAQYRAGRYNRALAEQNARIAEYQAEDAIARGLYDEKLLRGRVRAAIGTARASYAGQGVDVNEGTPADMQVAMAMIGERDALVIRNNAAREAWGYRVQAADYRARGRLAAYQGMTQAIGTVLGGASDFLPGGRFYGVFGRSSSGRSSPNR